MKSVLVGLAFASVAATAQARELHAIVTPPLQPALQTAGPACAAQGGHTLAAAPSLPQGVADTPATRAERNLPLDIFIQAAPQVDRGIADGHLAAGSKVDLVRTSLAIGVKTDAPKPDVSTMEALGRTLVNANSFGYSAFTSGNFLTMEAFPKLAVWDQVKGKGKVVPGLIGRAVASGDVEIGFQQVPELMAVPGLQVVRLPREAQLSTLYSAAVAARSAAPADARAYIACLASAATAPALERAGLEPVARAR